MLPPLVPPTASGHASEAPPAGALGIRAATWTRVTSERASGTRAAGRPRARRSDRAAHVGVQLRLARIYDELPSLRQILRVDAVGPMDRHGGAGLQAHLRDDLRRVEDPFREQVQEQLASLSAAAGGDPCADEQIPSAAIKFGKSLVQIFGCNFVLPDVDGLQFRPWKAEVG